MCVLCESSIMLQIRAPDWLHVDVGQIIVVILIITVLCHLYLLLLCQAGVFSNLWRRSCSRGEAMLILAEAPDLLVFWAHPSAIINSSTNLCGSHALNSVVTTQGCALHFGFSFWRFSLGSLCALMPSDRKAGLHRCFLQSMADTHAHTHTSTYAQVHI